jgi:hypothetical protein
MSTARSRKAIHLSAFADADREMLQLAHPKYYRCQEIADWSEAVSLATHNLPVWPSTEPSDATLEVARALRKRVLCVLRDLRGFF